LIELEPFVAVRRTSNFRFMKKVICISLVSGILSAALAAPIMPAAGSGSQTAVAPVAPRTGVTPVVPATGTQPGTQPGVQNGVNGQFDSQKSANSQFTVTSNAPAAGTNDFAGTNGLNGTNNFAGTNGFNGTNNVTAIVNTQTNSFPITVNSNFNGNVVLQDQAVTPSDRILLTTLSQGVRATLGITPNGNTPVHFLIQNGTVTVTGTVQSTAQSQAVLAQVQQTPGVLSVVNDMHVTGPYAPAVQNRGTASLLGVPTDRAFSAADQTLLTTVQQEAALQLGVTAMAQMPVHFTIQNGVVGVSGQVSSFQEKQALIASIQRTPGIVRVVDNVSVISTTGTRSGNVSGNSINNGSLLPTGNQSSNFFLNTTNSSGF
jgi:hypothetical protein